MADPVFPTLIPPPVVPYPRVTAGGALTALGYETSFAFAAGASVTDPGAGGLTHAWTLVSKPAGSTLTTANIHDPTSLTGAHLNPVWDRPGLYVFLLTSTDALGHTATSTARVAVGTSEGYLAICRIRWGQLANRDLKAEGNGAKTFVDCGTLAGTFAGLATPASCAIVNGVGLVTVSQAGGSVMVTHPALSSVFPRTGRVGTYVMLHSGSLAGCDVGGQYETTGFYYYNGAGSKVLYMRFGDNNFALGCNFVNQYGSSFSAGVVNTTHKDGIAINDQTARQWYVEGTAWGDDPVIDALAPSKTGSVLQTLNPGGVPDFDHITDHFSWALAASSGGGDAYTYVVTDTWVLWKP